MYWFIDRHNCRRQNFTERNDHFSYRSYPFLTARESVAAASVHESSWLRNDLYALAEKRITGIPWVIFTENVHYDATKGTYKGTYKDN